MNANPFETPNRQMRSSDDAIVADDKALEEAEAVADLEHVDLKNRL